MIKIIILIRHRKSYYVKYELVRIAKISNKNQTLLSFPNSSDRISEHFSLSSGKHSNLFGLLIPQPGYYYRNLQLTILLLGILFNIYRVAII